MILHLLRRQWLFLAVLFFAVVSFASDQYTAVVVSPLTPGTQAVLGTDEKMHIVYELVLTNTSPTLATLEKLEVLDGSSPPHVLLTLEGPSLLKILRSTGNSPAANTELDFNSTRLLLLEISLPQHAQVPRQLLHRLTALAAARPGPAAARVSQSYTVAPFTVGTTVPVIGPPLQGKGWVAVNGCCAAGGVHRGTGLSVNGAIHFAQRFAIDWMKLDDAGRMVHGDAGDVHNYTNYGAAVLAVADGTVVETLNNLNDQMPGKLPDPNTITLDNIDGNHVVLDLGNGVYAFYAHMQKGSVAVSVGDHVKRGQVLGKLGNSGNTSAPHLHFHLMNGPSPVGSSGLPYVIDSFAYDGQVPNEKFEASTDLTGDWGEGRLGSPNPRRHEFPMDLAIIDFDGAK